MEWKLVREYLKTDFEPYIFSEDYIYKLIKLNNLEEYT